MNVIIEGADATGKTTIAKRLQNKYGMNIIHLTNETPNDFNYHFGLLNNNDHAVFDRFLVGELIYPVINGEKSKLNKKNVDDLMDKIKRNNDAFIILYASDVDILRDRLIARGELEQVKTIDYHNLMFMKKIKQLMEYGYPRLYPVDVCDLTQVGAINSVIDRLMKE